MGRKRKAHREMPLPRVYWHRGKWQYKVPNHRRSEFGRAWVPLGKTIKEAHQVYSEQVLKEPGNTIDWLFDWYIGNIIPEKAQATQKGNLRCIEKLRPVFGQMIPEDLRRTHMQQFLRIRGKSGHRQANMEFSLMSHMFNCAINEGLVNTEVNPCQGVRKLPEPPRTIHVTDEMLITWVDLAPPVAVCYSWLAYMTGIRRSDLLSMKLDQLRDDGIRVTPRKTARLHKTGLYPWTDVMRDVVDTWRRHRKVSSVYLISNRAGQRYTGDGWSSNWARWMRKMPEGMRFAPNDIRPAYATELERQGGNVTAALMHSSRRVTELYLRGKTAREIPVLR